MSEYPNYTLEQLAQLILKLDMKEGVSPAGLGTLQVFAKSALENVSRQPLAPDSAVCAECGEKLSSHHSAGGKLFCKHRQAGKA